MKTLKLLVYITPLPWLPQVGIETSTTPGGSMRQRHTVLAGLILAILMAACGPANVVLTTDTTPICSGEALAEWDRVTNLTQGVKGQDPVGYYIADFPAEKFGIFNINNWQPLSGYKEILCGELHHFNVYDGSGAEMDWNHFMIPTADFQFLITDALPYKGGSGTWCVDDDWQDCEGEDDCLEGELTPDQTFYENPFFPKSSGESAWEGRQICMYGPWIRECVHGHRPEIHPAEVTWWKEKWHDADLYWLMALQDDSNRFDEEDEFDIEGTQPAEWRPWANAPMSAKFQLAFRVNVAGPHLKFEIGEAFAQNVVTSADAQARLDADDGTQHAIQYNGQIVLRANENQPQDTDLGVTFADVCRRADGSLLGYVTIATKTGVNNDGEEGYHILYVTRDEEGRPTRPFDLPDTKIAFRIVTQGDPSTIRPEAIAGRQQLVGDVEVEVARLKGATPQDTVVKVELLGPYAKGEISFEPNRRGTGGRIKGLPILEAARIGFVMQSGARSEAEWPGATVAALVDERIQEASDAPRSVSQAMTKAAGGLPVEAPAALKPKLVNQVQLTALPRYAMRKDGRVSLEEDSPFVERLSEVLSKGAEEEIRKVFGTAQPLKIEWSFAASNLTTGAPIAVERGTPRAPGREAESVVVTDVPGKTPGEAVQLTFPRRPEAVYQVTATAKVTDVFGSTSETRHQVSSHFLTDGSRAAIVDPLLAMVAAAAGVSAEELAAVAKLGILPQDDPRRRDPRIRRALVVRNVALQAANDSRVTLDELAGLIRGAALLR